MQDVLLGTTTSPDQYPFQLIYDRLASMEGQMVGANTRRPIVHIGTGWPGTAIGLYRQYGTPVTCVEKDPAVARKSKEALQRLGLLGRDKLQVVAADGANINPEGYAAVLVSAMVPNDDKETIIDNMRNLAKGYADPSLILRTAADAARTLFYEDLGFTPISGATYATVEYTTSLMSSEDPLTSYICKIREMAAVSRGEDRRIMETRRRIQSIGV